MHLPARTTADDDKSGSPEPARRERLVTGLAVATVAIAALAAAVMHPRPDGPRLALTGAGVVQAPPLDAGSRVTVEGGTVRVLPDRPGPG